jgi:branched-chain amino acid transport system substrate-binding protein
LATYAPIVKVIQDCFNAVNADGGIYGRKITFLVEDDMYNPANTVPLTKKLVEQDKIFADVSPLGTPTNTAIADYMNENKVPQLYVATGAAKWGADVKNLPWTIGFQPDYIVEGQNFAQYIQTQLKGKKVGLLYQNDDYGKDYITGLTQVLGQNGTADNPIVDKEVYEATATDLSSQVTNLKNKGAEVLVLVATPVPAGLVFKSAADQGWKPTVILNSVGIASNLNDLAGGNPNIAGVISDNYYHTAVETTDPSVVAVQQFLAKNDPGGLQLSNFAVFGYMVSQLWIETLKRAGVNPTRASLIQAAESFQHFTIPQLLKGIDVNTSKTDHRPTKCIQFLKYDDKNSTSYFGDISCGKAQ